MTDSIIYLKYPNNFNRIWTLHRLNTLRDLESTPVKHNDTPQDIKTFKLKHFCEAEDKKNRHCAKNFDSKSFCSHALMDYRAHPHEAGLIMSQFLLCPSPFSRIGHFLLTRAIFLGKSTTFPLYKLPLSFSPIPVKEL